MTFKLNCRPEQPQAEAAGVPESEGPGYRLGESQPHALAESVADERALARISPR
jgi:hypothetical protein